MADNPYTREMQISVVELVPDRAQLPTCQGWKADGSQCGYVARYLFNDKPACGLHSKATSLWYPEVRRG